MLASLSAVAAGYVRGNTTDSAPLREQLLAGAYRHSASGHYRFAVCSSDGSILLDTSLPARGHACLFRANSRDILVFARRPGRYLKVIDTRDVQHTLTIDCPAGRHFYGHGCFDPSSRLLFATENDYESGRGVIGVYDATQHYRRVTEFDSYGVGPHDIQFMPDGRTLVVANGGVETHPDWDREKLNLATMRSNLSLIDSSSGELLQHYAAPSDWQRLSLRHLAVSRQAGVFVGAQYYGPASDQVPLLAHLGEAGLKMIELPAQTNAALKNYVSSVCHVPGTGLFVASASRGDISLVYDSATEAVVATLPGKDASGLAAGHSQLFRADGYGRVERFQFDGLQWRSGQSLRFAQRQWDNHIGLSH